MFLTSKSTIMTYTRVTDWF